MINHNRQTLVFTFFLTASLMLPFNAIASLDIPAVPISINSNLPSPPKSMRKKTAKPLSTATRKTEIKMEIGVNQLVHVAKDHLNRLITPFDEPKVTTLATDLVTEIRDNVVYVGTDKPYPLTLFITNGDDEERALSLTLIPKKIPPKELFLTLNHQSSDQIGFTQHANKWEVSQPYLLTIEKVFKDLALGKLPSGYSFKKVPQGELPYCQQTGLEFDFKNGQTAIGHNLIIHIGIITNISPTSIEFKEMSCGNWDIAAVAAYPLLALNPRDKTEVYVAQKRYYKQQIRVKRPSLLRGAMNE